MGQRAYYLGTRLGITFIAFGTVPLQPPSTLPSALTTYSTVINFDIDRYGSLLLFWIVHVPLRWLFFSAPVDAYSRRYFTPPRTFLFHATALGHRAPPHTALTGRESSGRAELSSRETLMPTAVGGTRGAARSGMPPSGKR